MTNRYAIALKAINEARLTDKMHALAARLLSLVHPDNGYASLTWNEAMAVCGVTNPNSVWKYFGRLKAAGIIHYNTNGMVDVTFEAWRLGQNQEAHLPPAEGPRAASGRRARQDATPNREAHAPLAEGEDRNREAHAPPAEGGPPDWGHPIGWLVGNDPTTHPGKSLNQPTKPGRTIDEATQRRNLALLTDPEVGVWRKDAERLASEHDFEWVLRHVFAWLEDKRAGKVSKVKALIHRLDKAFAPGDLTERDRASPLYRRHVSEEEERERDAARYVPDEFSAIINT